LSPAELQTLFVAFHTPKGFDFKTFANALYPQDGKKAEEKQTLSPQQNQAQMQYQQKEEFDETYAKTVQQQHSPKISQEQQKSIKSPTCQAKEPKILIKPRITHNRPYNQQTLRLSAQEKHIFPEETPYPTEEFKAHGKYSSTEDKPRFEMKPLPQARYETNKKRNK